MDLVPIKVKIGLRPNGHADHPDWTKLPMINDSKEVWLNAPQGWIYDKSCGHKEHRADSPQGMQWGCLLCTKEFANEALAVFPTLVTKITEAEFEDFYNNYARAHLPENRVDINVMQGYQIELDLKEKLGLNTTALKAKIAKALDPEDKEAGIKKSKLRYWSDLKSNCGITIEAAK